jgi:phosphoribosylglycinamide formyltransferase-1
MTISLGVLVSGGGTNLQAILDAIALGKLDAKVVVVISNRKDAGALARAQQAGVPTVVIPHAEYADRRAFDRALVTALRERGAEWVVLAGFMRLLTDVFLDAYAMRTVNVHPALLPAFPGVDSQRQALDYGVRVAGCTVHFVDRGTDTGPIIAQAVVPVLQGDDEAALAARILEREHELLPLVLQWLAEGRVGVEGAPGAGARPRVVVRGALTAFGLGRD